MSCVTLEREETTEDSLLAGKVRLMQLRRGHRAGTDAVLLAAATAHINADTVIDVGAATGAVGLMIGAHKPHSRLIMIEKDETLAKLCRRNIEANGMSGSATMIVADVLDDAAVKAAGIRRGIADLVVSNPPYIEEGRARLSPDLNRRIAHALPSGGLDAWILFCTSLLKPKGTLILIHRSDRLPDCLRLMPADMGAFRIRTIHPREGEPANRVLLAATKGRRSPAIVDAPLILHDGEGAFSSEAFALHQGDWD